MSSVPSLSVIIPVYNVELYVEDAIRSVTGQNFADFEIIAINDGSTDSSADIIKRIMQTEPRLQLYHQENRGLASTRNRGLDMARGDYIYFLDADDMLKPGTLDKILARIQSTESELIYFPGQFLSHDGQTFSDKPDFTCFEQETPISGEHLFLQLNKHACYSPNVQKYVYTKTFLLTKKLRFEDGFSHEDEAFSIKALCLADKAVSFKQTMMYKRLRPNSIMSSEKILHNVQGWLQAATSVVRFSESKRLLDETKQVIDEKARMLILTAKKTARKIKQRDGADVSIYEHIDKEILDKLGGRFKLRLTFDRIFQIFYKLTS